MNPVLADVFDHLDRVAASRLYARASVDPDRERARLRAAGRPHLSADGPSPSPEELEATSAWVIEGSTRRRQWFARLSALGGAASLPSDVAVRSLGIVRLAQRLAIVYGFDPHDDRGRMALQRALSVGLQIPMPEGPLNPRLSDLTRAGRSTSSQLTRALVGTASQSAVPSLQRLIPVLGAVGVSEPTSEIGARMAGVFSRLVSPARAALIEDVQEL